VIEWVFAGVSAVFVAGLMTYLGYQAAFGEHQPPQLSVTIERQERTDDGMRVLITVRNTGDEAASEVTVEAAVTGSDVRKDITFDYVAPQAMRRGAFLFAESELATGGIQLSVDGYVEP